MGVDNGYEELEMIRKELGIIREELETLNQTFGRVRISGGPSPGTRTESLRDPGQQNSMSTISRN